MAEIYPAESWPSDAEVALLDGTVDAATGLPFIPKGTGPASSPPLEIQYNRAQQRLMRIAAPWNQGRMVEEVGGTLGIYPLSYSMNGAMQQFDGASGIIMPDEGPKVFYLDVNGLLQVQPAWPSDGNFVPLAQVTVTNGRPTIVDCRPYGVFRGGGEMSLWPLVGGVKMTVEAGEPGQVDVTLQAVDAADVPAARVLSVHAWLSDAALTGETVEEPSGGVSAVIGSMLSTEAGGKRWRVLTADVGVAVLRIAHGGARTWYLNVEIAGRVTASSPIQF